MIIIGNACIENRAEALGPIYSPRCRAWNSTIFSLLIRKHSFFLIYSYRYIVFFFFCHHFLFHFSHVERIKWRVVSCCVFDIYVKKILFIIWSVWLISFVIHNITIVFLYIIWYIQYFDTFFHFFFFSRWL